MVGYRVSLALGPVAVDLDELMTDKVHRALKTDEADLQASERGLDRADAQPTAVCGAGNEQRGDAFQLPRIDTTRVAQEDIANSSTVDEFTHRGLACCARHHPPYLHNPSSRGIDRHDHAEACTATESALDMHASTERLGEPFDNVETEPDPTIARR